jgi:hypothetical protein
MPDGIRIDSGGVDVALTAGGDIVGGNKITVQLLVQQIKKEVKFSYKFLSHYEIWDRDIFFGRQSATDEVVGYVDRSSVVLLNGQSGAGKSSSVNAGVLPALADKGYFYIRMREYTDPIQQLNAYFRDSEAEQQKVTGTPLSLLDLVTRKVAECGTVVVVLDQFERFFLSVPDQQRQRFIQQLKDCLASGGRSKQFAFLIVVREDLFGRLVAEFEAQISNFLRDNAHVNLRPLAVQEARRAILEPLKDVPKIGFDSAFVDSVLLPQLGRQSPGEGVIEPSHLQIVCNRLYVEARRRVDAKPEAGQVVSIDKQMYTDLGGAKGILEYYLDEAVNRVAEEEAEQIKLVRPILKLMVQSGRARKFLSLEEISSSLSIANT